MQFVTTDGALITINATMVIQLVSFLIFVWLINRIMFRPLKTIMEERQTHLLDLELEMTKAQEDLQALTHTLQTRERTVSEAAQSERKALEAAGGQAATAILSDASQKIAQLRQETANHVAAQLTKARQHIEAESVVLADRVMEQILKRELVS